MHLDKSNQLHYHDGPALVFADGSELYASQGHLIPEFVVNRNFGVSEIELATTKHVQSAMLSVYGARRYLGDVNAEEICRHEQVILYRRGVNVGEQARFFALYETEIGCCYFRWIPETHHSTVELALNWALEARHGWNNELEN